MANRIQLSVDVRGMARMRTILNRLAKRATTRRDLHAQWAVLALNWINRNFQSEGGMVGGWKPLSPNTLAARRGGSGRILQDTGQLRASFIPRWTSEDASVGSAMKTALWHEKGTDPYTIKPLKPGGFLRFKMATESGVKTKELKSGRKVQLRFAKGDYVYAKEVHHPGLPARPMLPRTNEPTLMAGVMKAALQYVSVQQEVGNVKD